MRHFSWMTESDAPNEDNQCGRYMAYLQNNLDATLKARRLVLVDVHSRKTMLDTNDDLLQFKVRGGTDLIIMKDSGNATMNEVTNLSGLRMLIELKKDLNERYETLFSQADIELIAADLKSVEAPVLLLSDLNHMWVFMWLDDRCLYRMTLEQPTNAFRVIQEYLTNQRNESNQEICIPFSSGRPNKKMKLVDLVKNDGAENDSLQDMIERYISIAPDIDDSDMTLEREIGLQVVKTIPAYMSMYAS